MQWVTLIVGLIGGLGIGSWITGFFDRKAAREEADRQRTHESNEVRAVRTFERRATAYQAESIDLERWSRYVSLTESIRGQPVEAPEGVSPDEEWVKAGGIIAITASDSIREKLRSLVAAFRDFQTQVNVHRRVRDGLEAPVAAVDSGAELEKAREKVLALIQDAQTAMRDELDAL